MLGLLLVACSDSLNGTTPTPSLIRLPNEITIWSWGVGLKGLKANLPSFNQAHPTIKVTLTEVSPPELYAKLEAGLRAGGVGLPDVVQVETERLDFFINKFPEGFADLRSWASKYEGAFDALKWFTVHRDGRIRALPWDSSPVGLYYRADLFQRAGIDASTITTWDEYLKAGQRLQAFDPKLKLLAFYPNDDSLLQVLMNQQEASYFTLDGKINLISPEVVHALTLIKQMYTAGLLVTVSDSTKIIPALQAGEAASYVAGPSWATLLQEKVPEMTGKWDIMPLPALLEGGERHASLGGLVLAALRTGKNQESASAFMEYCLANKESQNLMLKQVGLLPSFLPAYEDPFYSTSQPFFNNKPLWQFFGKEVSHLKLVNYTTDFELASDAATKAQLLALLWLDPFEALEKKANALKDLTSREVFKPELRTIPFK